MAIKSNTQTTITDNPEISRTITRYQNVDENEIVITESKLENILMKYKESLSAGSDWKTPMGLIIAIVTFFLTAEFNKEFLGLKPDVWQAVFIIGLFLSIYWLCKSFYLIKLNWNETLEKLIERIKNSEKEQSKSQREKESKDLKVIRATYGIEEAGKSVDVTNKINAMIKDNHLDFNVTNALVESDPAPGTVKKLIIKYQYNEESFSKEYIERNTVTLP